MRKEYIMPQTEAQHITTGQLICTSTSPNPSIQKGDPVPVVPGEGRYV